MGLTKVYDKCSINARSKKDPASLRNRAWETLTNVI